MSSTPQVLTYNSCGFSSSNQRRDNPDDIVAILFNSRSTLKGFFQSFHLTAFYQGIYFIISTETVLVE